MTRLSDYHDIVSEINTHWDNQSGPAFGAALGSLRAIAEQGHEDAPAFLAEILALPGPCRDPAAAYKWYFIALGRQGFSVAFQDENDTPPFYCGPVGDFRNESMVSGLVEELGFERVRALDAEALAWLQAHGLRGT